MKSHSQARGLPTPTWLALGLAGLLICGCATQSPKASGDIDNTRDPYEPTNRKLYAVNDTLDRNVVHPVAAAYRDTVPATVRNHLHNVLSNLANPTQLANDMLQGKPRKAGNTLMRLLINTTIGVGGVFDLAGDWGWPDHDTDFGLTLGVWGVPDGPYLFLPVLGPSDFRDASGYGVNTVLDPLTWVSFSGSATLGWTRFGTGALDGRARALNVTDGIDKTALDPYATYRSLYQQHRASALDAARVDLPGTPTAWYRPSSDVSSGASTGASSGTGTGASTGASPDASSSDASPDASPGVAPPAAIKP